MILNKIEDRIRNVSGDIGINYLDLKTGYHCFAGNCDVFPSSGISKLFVLIEVFNQLEAKKITAEDIYFLKEEDCKDFQGEKILAPSFGVLQFLHPGIELTMKDLYQLMVTVSDNTAFNLLLRILGKENVNKTLQKIGFKKCEINRECFDWGKIKKGINNSHSLIEVSEILHRIYLGQLISKKASEEIAKVMMKHQRTNVIPYSFSEDFPIAHQSGFDEGLIHDVGIVYAENPFILTMSASDVDTRKTESVMRDVSLICYKHSNP